MQMIIILVDITILYRPLYTAKAHVATVAQVSVQELCLIRHTQNAYSGHSCDKPSISFPSFNQDPEFTK